jgi:hypothetical protein
MPEATVFPGAAPLQPESPARPAPAPVVTFTVLPDVAVKAVLPRGVDLNDSAAAHLYSRVGELAGDRRVAVVLELTGVRSVTRAARAAFAAMPSVSAWAILGESPVDRLLGHFLLGGEFGSVPARYFDDENDALHWLSHLDDVL